MALCAGAYATDTPTLSWSYKAKSNLYAPPLVADIHPTQGLETVLSDSEARVVRCLDATGNLLWTYDGKWKKRLTASAALRKGTPDLLAIPGSDGLLCCIKAETGQEQWRLSVGGVTWGGVIWSDLDGDDVQELVVGASDAIVVLNAQGEEQWRWDGQALGKGGEQKLDLRTPLAVADVNEDGKKEIFGLDHFGPFALDATGKLQWSHLTVCDFLSAPTIADANYDGQAELYCASWKDNALWAFAANTGELLWQAPLPGGVDIYPNSAIPVADLDGDGVAEIIVGGRKGHLCVFSAEGEWLWAFKTTMDVPLAPSVGDIDGDEDIEILAASGDHHLYCLDSTGRLEWRYQTELRLMYPATISDVDQDGKTDILFCGSDRTLRCISLGGRYNPAWMPWPSRRFDTAQTGSSFKQSTVAKFMNKTQPLLPDGDFERAKTLEGKSIYPSALQLFEKRQQLPRAWQPAPKNKGSWELSTEKSFQGEQALKVSGDVVIVTELVSLPARLENIVAEAFACDLQNPKAAVCWLSNAGVLRKDVLPIVGDETGWTHFRNEDIVAPAGARWVLLECTSQGTGYWDAAKLDAMVRILPKHCTLVNQVGYDTSAPKHFMVQGNSKAANATFSVLDQAGKAVFSGELQHAGRIHGHFGNDWGYEYWQGDFSEFTTPGHYRIETTLDSVTDQSWPFEIAENLLWRTAQPAYRFFYYQRCGMAIPGFHEACHLDDAVSKDGGEQYECWGGWHDAGDYNTYHNAPYVYGLARAYGWRKAIFAQQDADENGQPDFLEEILWGGAHSRRMVAQDGSARGHLTSGYGFWGPPELETDNIPGTGDERPVSRERGDNPDFHQAALARIATLVQDKEPWVETAARSLNWALQNKRRGVYQLSTAVDLYRCTQDKQYETIARELIAEILAADTLPSSSLITNHGAALVDSVRSFDATFNEDHHEKLKMLLTKNADKCLTWAQNPFGVYTFGPAENPNFFDTKASDAAWAVGTSSHILQAATLVALAAQYDPKPEYRAFVYDQINWTLGMNPYDISLMEGQGSAFAPTYHHRYAFSGVKRGAVPGSVVNGITWTAPGEDRPFFDMSGADIPIYSPNECWLPHNTHYLNTLSSLYAKAAK